MILVNPAVYIIAGPNGAGKTTFANEFLPNYADCRQFVNADLIAQGLAPFAPDTAAIRAGRLVLEQIAKLAESQESFGFETTLSGRSYLRILRNEIPTISRHDFLSLASHGPCVGSSAGPHLKRWARSSGNRSSTALRKVSAKFFSRIRNLAHRRTLFDNSGGVPEPIAELRDEIRIIHGERYNRLVTEFAKNV